MLSYRNSFDGDSGISPVVHEASLFLAENESTISKPTYTRFLRRGSCFLQYEPSNGTECRLLDRNVALDRTDLSLCCSFRIPKTRQQHVITLSLIRCH